MIGKKIKIFALMSALAVTFSAATVQNTFAFDVEENSREREQLENQNSQIQEEIIGNRQEIKDKKAYRRELQREIQSLTAKIKESNKRISGLNDDIKEKQAQIYQKLEEIADRLDLLRTRLRTIYMAGDTSSLEIILGAKSFADLIDKSQMMKNVSDYDSNLINELQNKMDIISAEQKELRAKKQEVEKEKKTLEENKKKMNELSEENEKLIQELMDDNEKLRLDIKANEERQKVLEEALDQYNKELADKARQERIAQLIERQRQYRLNAQNDPEILGYSENGELVWPCPGYSYLTALYAEERYYGIHGAIDIAGGGIYGANVIACAPGIVFSVNTTCPHDYGKEASCGCGGGYGNYIMIDHLNGKVSVYAHLSGLAVDVGDEVQAGQVIGFVGTTGYSTGPHLHFELRYNGMTYDPLLEFQ